MIYCVKVNSPARPGDAAPPPPLLNSGGELHSPAEFGGASKVILSNSMKENPAVEKKMIVICDDNAALAVLMQHLLRKKGFRVMTAGDGSEGLALLRANAPDLLLLDLAMPGTDGAAVLEAMKSLAGKRPYTIVISGQKGRETLDRAAALGADETWKKPFNAADLIGRIEALIAQGIL